MNWLMSALFRRHLWPVFAFLVGILVGLLVALPLIPWTLPDSSATLLGSALGAAIAVAGAAIVADRDRQREDEQASMYLESLLAIICERLDSLQFALKCAQESAQLDFLDKTVISWLKSEAQSVREAVARTPPAFDSVRTFAHRVGVERMTQLEKAEDFVSEADTLAAKLVKLKTLEFKDEEIVRSFSTRTINVRRDLDTYIDLFSGGAHLKRIRSRRVWNRNYVNPE